MGAWFRMKPSSCLVPRSLQRWRYNISVALVPWRWRYNISSSSTPEVEMPSCIVLATLQRWQGQDACFAESPGYGVISSLLSQALLQMPFPCWFRVFSQGTSFLNVFRLGISAGILEVSREHWHHPLSGEYQSSRQPVPVKFSNCDNLHDQWGKKQI